MEAARRLAMFAGMPLRQVARVRHAGSSPDPRYYWTGAELRFTGMKPGDLLHEIAHFLEAPTPALRAKRNYGLAAAPDSTDSLDAREEIACCIEFGLRMALGQPLRDICRIARHDYNFDLSGASHVKAMARVGQKIALARGFDVVRAGRNLVGPKE